MNESILAFVPDRRKALSEYVRVTKTGGYIGFNESSYLKTPVPPKIEKFLKNTTLGAKTETAEYWKVLLAVYMSDPVNRKNIQALLAMQRHQPERFYEYFGYGIYVGRK